ncbi:MAG: RecX family transcriptional regulator [Bacteroidetes bacterium]|nr:RecX family transcriptional regulator [Bacteroidota bacterium]
MYKELLTKAMKYCAYQERCHQEVRNKLLEIGARGMELESIMVHLIEHNFLNEERFAIAFAGGKFRIKKWGIIKIVNELKKRDISEYCIKKALKEIEKEDYIKTLELLITKKSHSLKEENIYIKKNKIAKFVISKGYDPSLVWEQITKLI